MISVNIKSAHWRGKQFFFKFYVLLHIVIILLPIRLLPHSIPSRTISRPRGKWLVHSNQTRNTKAKTMLWITQSLVVVVFKSKYYGMIDIWKTWMVEHALRPGSHQVKAFLQWTASLKLERPIWKVNRVHLRFLQLWTYPKELMGCGFWSRIVR